MPEDKNQLKLMCRGNNPDRGWEQTPEGNWTPSLHDRRRVTVAEANMAAAILPDGIVPASSMYLIFHRNSRSEADLMALIGNFNIWQTGLQSEEA